jgi:uncharacterized protein
MTSGHRQFNPEVDLVGADRGPVAGQLSFVGSVKWLGTQFDQHDLRALHVAAAQVPGFESETTGLVAVCLSGFAPAVGPDSLGLTWGPNEVVGAWR